MSMSKEQIEKQVRRVQGLVDQVVLKRRLEWLNRVRREAEELGFSSLGELIAFMVDHKEVKS